MNTKQWVVGTIVGGIVLFVLGYLIFSLLLGSFYAANSPPGMDRETQIVWAVAVGSLAYAALIIYALGARGGSVTIASATKVGAIVGFLLWLCANFTLYGLTNLSGLPVAIVDPVAELVRAGITGAVLGVLLPKLA